jgi:exonuclease VII large subunit
MLDPKGVLQRGYSILLDDVRRAVRAPAETTPGQHLTALVAEGEIHVTVSAQ